ncbi:helix-turn-helix domain-containing protein [Halomonas salipaludis]|uniref:Helix-turn-helix domain-containing protein n=1 Tax=Halomonas salipaludis TaxID=2032625 RepID=A0A2A2EPT1_9GAMM|nr:helix-turn-helix domain-containing protein [Halomonas salipaludis]PAU74362.1 helix-turn-helix domain-containing protein [Halomonas salipaludis]
MPRGRQDKPHVRLYRHELESPAYRSLCLAARALLVEFRALYNRDNRIYMSVREVMRRLDVGQKLAERALAELLDRGFIVVLEKGTFNRKTKHATVYALTNEVVESIDKSIAPKCYMSWKA